jgi:hypothetical protein
MVLCYNRSDNQLYIYQTWRNVEDTSNCKLHPNEWKLPFFPPLYSYNCHNCSLMCETALCKVVFSMYCKFMDKRVSQFCDEIWHISLCFVNILPYWKMFHIKSVDLYVVIFKIAELVYWWGYWLDNGRILVWFPVGARDSSLLQCDKFSGPPSFLFIRYLGELQLRFETD